MFCWLNGVLVAKYYGNGDGPQKDFFLMDGLIRYDSQNELKLLCYDGREEKRKSTLEFEVKSWKISDSPEDSENKWSGNLDEKGKDFILLKETLKL